MLQRSLLARFLAPALLAALGAASAASCGDDEPTLACGADGTNCIDTGTTTGGQGGQGGQGGSSGQGGQGGQGGGVCDPATAVCPCDAGACPGALICAGGLCVPGCDYTYQCGPGKVCANSLCVPGCSDPAMCGPGATCENGICVPDPANPACGPQNPCPLSADICVDGQCAAACSTNNQCAGGEACNAGTGACMSDPAPQPTCDNVGSQCAGQGQTCMSDGYCHYACTDTPECKLIDNRFEACDGGICKILEVLNPECTSQIPCPAGLDCISNHCL